MIDDGNDYVDGNRAVDTYESLSHMELRNYTGDSIIVCS